MSLSAAILLLCLQSTAAKPATGQLQGRVVSFVTGQPIARAKVVVTGREFSSWLYTNGEGAFRFPAVPPGEYRVDVERNGYASDWAARLGGRTSGKLVVIEAEQTRDLQIKLIPHAVLAGRVVDEFGEPLGNATVAALRVRRSYGKTKYEPTIVAFTNDLGEYRLSGLLPGRYIVVADHRFLFQDGDTSRITAADPEERKFAQVTTYFPAALNPESATPLDVRAAAQLGGVNIQISKARRLRLSGVLRGAADPASFTVTLTAPEGFQLGDRHSQSKTPDREGRFAFEDLTPGSYVVRASEPGERPTVIGLAPVTLTTTDVENLPVAVGETPLVTGVLHYANDEAPRGVTDYPAPVFYLGDQRRNLGRDEFHAKEGAFSLRLTPGEYRIDMPKLPEGVYLKAILENGVERDPGRLPVTASTRLEFVLSMNAATVGGVATESTATDKPIPAARVVLWPADSPERAVTTLADGYGRFRVGNLAPGSYRLAAFTEGEPEELEDPEMLRELTAVESVTVKQGSTEGLLLKVRPWPPAGTSDR